MHGVSFWISAFWLFHRHSTFVLRHSQQVSHLRSLGLEIFGVVRIRFATNRHLFHHLEAVPFESDNFLRIVRQKTELADAKIEQDLGAETVIAQIAWVSKPGICLHRVETFLLQFVGVNFCCQPDPTAFLSHVNQNAAAFLLDLLQRRVELVSAIAPARAENVSGETLAVDAHQRRFVLVDLAFYQREMMLAIELRAVEVQIEIAIIGRHFYDLFQFYQFFADAAVCDQALDGANAEAMLLAELHQLRQSSHRAIVVQNLAKHSSRLQRSHACKVDRRLGVSGAPAAHRHLSRAMGKRDLVAQGLPAMILNWRSPESSSRGRMR